MPLIPLLDDPECLSSTGWGYDDQNGFGWSINQGMALCESGDTSTSFGKAPAINLPEGASVETILYVKERNAGAVRVELNGGNGGGNSVGTPREEAGVYYETLTVPAGGLTFNGLRALTGTDQDPFTGRAQAHFLLVAA